MRSVVWCQVQMFSAWWVITTISDNYGAALRVPLLTLAGNTYSHPVPVFFSEESAAVIISTLPRRILASINGIVYFQQLN